MRILGIETSCDETGIAIYDGEHGLLADALYSQVALHAPFGGVVPELASRDHIQKTLPLIQETMAACNTQPNQLDGIAYTAGPGLIGALLVGASIAKSLALAWNIPCIGVHHLESHLLAVLLEKPAPSFPFLALLVSGGHTLLVLVEKFGHYQILGQSIDDAAGEAFDKTAKLLGLGYPGGPALAELAKQGRPNVFHFPRPMTQKVNLDFSFSGLKTSVLHTLQKHTLDATTQFVIPRESAGSRHPKGASIQSTFLDTAVKPRVDSVDMQTKADIAHAFQEAVVETLLIKCQWALEQTGLKQLVVAGGVGANLALRAALTSLLEMMGGKAFFPRPSFCTDNGAMVAFAGYLHYKSGLPQPPTLEIKVKPRWPLDEGLCL